MDPLTHALAGAAVAWTVAGDRLGRKALVIGAAAALLPDADILIRSATDPLLAIEHHRGFTHSLTFVPIGGALVALASGRSDRRWKFVAAMIAWLSHALLDASTTYGTQLFWPFSRYRVGLDIISIVDPLFTAICLGGIVAAYRAKRRIVIAAIVCALSWLALGYAQRERAMAAQERLAESRGDRLIRGAVFPTVGNTIVWRSLYATSKNELRMDRIRVPWLAATKVTPVTTVPLVADASSAPDLARFAWFTDGWMAVDPSDPTVIGDARYSMHRDRYVPVWGIRLRPGTEWIDRSRDRRLTR